MSILSKKNKDDEFVKHINCAEKIIENCSNETMSDDNFIDYKAIFSNDITEETSEDLGEIPKNSEETSTSENSNINDTNTDYIESDDLDNTSSIEKDNEIDDSNDISLDNEFNSKLIRSYIPYTADIKPNDECTSLTVTTSNKIILASQIITKTIRFSFKSLLISISLTILNLFI